MYELIKRIRSLKQSIQYLWMRLYWRLHMDWGCLGLRESIRVWRKGDNFDRMIVFGCSRVNSLCKSLSFINDDKQIKYIKNNSNQTLRQINPILTRSWIRSIVKCVGFPSYNFLCCVFWLSTQRPNDEFSFHFWGTLQSPCSSLYRFSSIYMLNGDHDLQLRRAHEVKRREKNAKTNYESYPATYKPIHPSWMVSNFAFQIYSL